MSKRLSESGLERTTTFLLLPLLIFVLFLHPVLNEFCKLTSGFENDPRTAWSWTYSDLWASCLMIGRIDLGWYLRCLILWRLGSPLLRAFSDRAQIFLAFAIGASSASSHIHDTAVLNLQVP